MKIINIKTIVGMSNIFMYTIMVMIFLTFGHIIIAQKEFIFKINIFVFIIALAMFVFYHVFRFREIKKSKFKFTKKHKIFMWIFIITEYTFLFFTLLYLIITRVGAVNPLDTSILFYVFFSLMFLMTSTASVLESIVRIQEKIYEQKIMWKKSQKWEEEQKKLNQDTLDKKKNNPFDI